MNRNQNKNEMYLIYPNIINVDSGVLHPDCDNVIIPRMKREKSRGRGRRHESRHYLQNTSPEKLRSKNIE